MTSMQELLTVKDVARICKVHEVTVRRHIAAGKLRSVRIGRAVRVRPEDLESYADDAGSAHEGFTPDNPFMLLVGTMDDPDGWWIARDKKRALAGFDEPASGDPLWKDRP